MEHIRYLLHEHIDKEKWDNCIQHAANGLVYACSDYLDSMATQWDALILNDYEMVMPLPCRKKMGIAYLFQPSITPSLGIFGNAVTAATVSEFINAIPKKFKLLDISFNSGNIIAANEGVTVPRNNYVLDITAAYTTIQQGYSENIQRNIAKAIKSGCVLKKDISFEAVAAICKKEFPKFTNVEDGLFEKLYMVYKSLKNNSSTYGVVTKEGVLLASCIFLFYKNRAYYWLVGNTTESKQFGASSLLIDAFIKEYAEKNILLDFEGSDTPSVANFYKKFGAVAEPYTTLYTNKLIFPFNLLKPLPQHYRSIISK